MFSSPLVASIFSVKQEVKLSLETEDEGSGTEGLRKQHKDIKRKGENRLEENRKITGLP